MKKLPVVITSVFVFFGLLLKAQESNGSIQSTEKSDFWLWMVIIIESVIIIAGIILIRMSIRADEKRKHTRSKKQTIKREEPMYGSLVHKQDSSSQMIHDRLIQLDRKMDDIYRRTEDIFLKLGKNSMPEPGMNAPKLSDEREVLYLKQRNGNIFNQVSTSPEGCFFQLINGQEKTARFRFTGNEDYAINNKNEVFDDVCEVSGSALNAKAIKNLENGIVEKQFDDKWKVTRKAKIKFE